MLKYIVALVCLLCASVHVALAEEADQDILTNEELNQFDLPEISVKEEAVLQQLADTPEEANDEDVIALKEAIVRKDIIENKAASLPFVFLPHRPNYIMPFAYMQSTYEDPYADILGEEWPGFQHWEAIFQISLKYQIYKFDKANRHKLFVAYTNKSYWQVYNSKLSRPFRETNHEPELIYQFTPNWGYINRVQLSLNHQSNGQYQQFSRSWNRLIAGFYHADGNSIYGLEPWWRLPETSKADPEDPTDNDNPDIHSYIGYGNFIWFKKWKRFSALLRLGNNFQADNNRGWVELEWNFPVTPRVRGFLQYYEGYGHNLIEYDLYQRRIGLGFKISDYL